MKTKGITEDFEEVEVTKEYDGYYYSVSEAITIVILGSKCGLKNASQIQQWAANDRVTMQTISKAEENGGRIKRRTAYVTGEIDWL